MISRQALSQLADLYKTYEATYALKCFFIHIFGDRGKFLKNEIIYNIQNIVLQVIHYEYHHCQNKNQSMGLKKLINVRFEKVKF